MFRFAASAARRVSPCLIRCQPGPVRASPSALQLHIRNKFNPTSSRLAGLRIFHTSNGAFKDMDKEREKKKAEEKLKSDPSQVSSTSTVRPLFERSQSPEDVPDMSQSLKKDINIIVDTVALRTVPKEAYVLGLAGTLPYLGTSLSTLYLGWDLKQTWAPGVQSLFMLTHEHAQQLLAFLEPVQLGYGAVIISFLGAIHWGMQFNEHKPAKDCTRFRYTMGVISPAVAWPTLMMPFEYALMSQMTAFTLLYFADTRAAAKGWAPAWYGTYRFVLTFVVCSAIVLSLVGRQKVTESSSVLAADELRMRADMAEYKESHSPKWKRIEEEEIEKRKAQDEKEKSK